MKQPITRLGVGAAIALGATLVLAMVASAAAPLPGAIFTTVSDGSEVNYNIYAAKTDVYLDGGPGPGAPATAAGLPDGVYVFMVTDPSGKTLLSTDIAACRRFTVTGGIITGLVTTTPTCSSPHLTGLDVDHGATTVQLMPYNDTPNPGGEYKAWVTPIGQFQCNLNQVDCSKHGSKHGFVPSSSKTDNFKVRVPGPVEIDSRFFHDLNGDGHFDSSTESYIDGLQVTWHDTLGASNIKTSYYDASLDVNHEAHVEDAEAGIHQITIADQPGCKVGLVHVDNVDQQIGPQTVSVQINSTDVNRTVFVDIACE